MVMNELEKKFMRRIYAGLMFLIGIVLLSALACTMFLCLFVSSI